MIARRIETLVQERPGRLPVVGLPSPRQVGKTTLAQTIAATRNSICLDLESPVDCEKSDDDGF